jgi:hypothetical protein
MLPRHEVMGETRVVHQRLASPVKPFQVAGSAALGDEPSAWLQRGEQARKQPIVIAHPVQRRRAEDGVGDASEWQRRRVSADERDSGREGGQQVTSRRREHVL